MSLNSDGEDVPVKRSETPEMMFENTFSDTDDEVDEDDDVIDEKHQTDDPKNSQPFKGASQTEFPSLELDLAETGPSFDTSQNLENAENSIRTPGASPIPCSSESDSRIVLDQSSPEIGSSPSGSVPETFDPATSSPSTFDSTTLLDKSPGTVSVDPGPALKPPANTSKPASMFAPSVDGLNPGITFEQLPSDRETAFDHFVSNWTLNEEDLKCYPFRKSTTSSSTMNKVSTNQVAKRKKGMKYSKSYRYGSGYRGASKLINMSPYAMLARMAKSGGYDLSTFLETLEFSGPSSTLPCMQCYEKYGGTDPGFGSMDGDYVAEGMSERNGRCQTCGGQVHTMASYGVMLRKLKEIIMEKDFIPYDVYPDGNCLFAAVIDQLHIHGDFSFSMHSLRLASVEYIRNNPALGDGTPIEMFLTEETLDAYLDRMSMDGVWGDHIILSAVANVISMQIFIYGGMSGQNETIVSPKNVSAAEDHCGNDSKNIYLGHIGESHYFSLRPRNWKDNSYDDLVEMKVSEKAARYPMQYFNFMLTQIFRMDTSNTMDNLTMFETLFMSPLEEAAKEEEFTIEVFGPTICKLDSHKTEPDSMQVDITTLFPSAKVEDVLQADGGLFLFKSPKDTAIVSESITAKSFDLIIEPHRSIGLFKLVPSSPRLWEGQTVRSTNKLVCLKNIFIFDKYENMPPLAPLVDDISKDSLLKVKIVFAFKSTWPKVTEEWATRLRTSNFPNSHTVETIIKTGCHVISQKDGIKMADYLEQPEPGNNADIVWCYSFAFAEKEICRFISPEQRQCYFLFRSTAGMVPSRHMLPMAIFKSIFFFSCENILESTWLSKPGESYFIMLKKLSEGLKYGFIPHYFMPEKNLLESVTPETIVENQKMLAFARFQPVTSLYFVLGSLKLMSSEMCSFVEEMIQDACNTDPKDDQQKEQITRACMTLLSGFIADEKYQNAMLVFNSLVEQTDLSSEKSVEILNKQLPHIALRSKWCFTLYVDIRQKSSLTNHLCHGMLTVRVTELFGPDCTEELPDTCLPERYSINNGDLFFIDFVTEVLEQCVSTKVQTKCLKYYLKKYSELAGDALVLPFGGIDEYQALYSRNFKKSESYLEQILCNTLASMHVRLFNIYYTKGPTEEFRDLLPAYESLMKDSENPSHQRNLYLILKSLGETEKAAAINRKMKNGGVGNLMLFMM